MAITVESLTSSGPQSAADPAAVAVATESERSVIPIAVASFAIAVACANGDGHLHSGHSVCHCLHNGHNDLIVDNGISSLSCLSNENEGNALSLRLLAGEVVLLWLLSLLSSLLLYAPLSNE
jgi:hypothetical protein